MTAQRLSDPRLSLASIPSCHRDRRPEARRIAARRASMERRQLPRRRDRAFAIGRAGAVMRRLHARQGGGYTVGIVPPSMTYSVPRIAGARSEARQVSRSAMSSGLAGIRGNALERLQNALARGLCCTPAVGRQPLHQRIRRLRVDPARRDDVHPHALRPDFLRKGLAVGRQRRFRRGIGRC